MIPSTREVLSISLSRHLVAAFRLVGLEASGRASEFSAILRSFLFVLVLCRKSGGHLPSLLL